MSKKITVSVPVELVGEPIGVKTKGGILEALTREIDVECLPADIPDSIKVDVSGLDVGDSIQVKDIRAEKVRLVSDPEMVIANVVAPTVVEEVKVEEAAEEVEAKPEAEAEKKEEEGKAEEKKPEAEKKSE